jgi:hypothetical protein
VSLHVHIAAFQINICPVRDIKNKLEVTIKADSAFGFMNQSVASSDFSAVDSYQALNYKPKSAQDGEPKIILRNR